MEVVTFIEGTAAENIDMKKVHSLTLYNPYLLMLLCSHGDSRDSVFYSLRQQYINWHIQCNTMHRLHVISTTNSYMLEKPETISIDPTYQR